MHACQARRRGGRTDGPGGLREISEISEISEQRLVIGVKGWF
jgi:hypothetical protein